MNDCRYLKLLTAAFTLIISQGIFAANASIKALGRGGAAIAFTEDSLSAAYNPAGAAELDNRFDIEVIGPVYGGDVATWGSPVPEANSRRNPYSHARYSLYPNIGINCRLNCDWSVGLIAYNRNQIKTSYSSSDPIIGTTRTGYNIWHETISPYLAYKLNNMNFGISFDWHIQRTNVKGLQHFDNALLSSAPGYVTNRGYNTSNAMGITVGVQIQIADRLTIGAFYSPRVRADRFKKYKGLYADRGRFAIPNRYGVGFKLEPFHKAAISFDYERIEWRHVYPLSNALPQTLIEFVENPLGSRKGAGFGFNNQDIFRAGIDYAFSDSWTFRAGYRHMSKLFSNRQVAINFLTNEVIEEYATLGATWTIGTRNEINFLIAFGIENKRHGRVPDYLAGGTTRLKKSMTVYGLGWSCKF